MFKHEEVQDWLIKNLQDNPKKLLEIIKGGTARAVEKYTWMDEMCGHGLEKMALEYTEKVAGMKIVMDPAQREFTMLVLGMCEELFDMMIEDLGKNQPS